MKLKVGDNVRILEAFIDINLIGEIRKIIKINELGIYLEGARSRWGNEDCLKLVDSKYKHINKIYKIL